MKEIIGLRFTENNSRCETSFTSILPAKLQFSKFPLKSFDMNANASATFFSTVFNNLPPQMRLPMTIFATTGFAAGWITKAYGETRDIANARNELANDRKELTNAKKELENAQKELTHKTMESLLSDIKAFESWVQKTHTPVAIYLNRLTTRGIQSEKEYRNAVRLYLQSPIRMNGVGNCYVMFDSGDIAKTVMTTCNTYDTFNRVMLESLFTKSDLDELDQKRNELVISARNDLKTAVDKLSAKYTVDSENKT